MEACKQVAVTVASQISAAAERSLSAVMSDHFTPMKRERWLNDVRRMQWAQEGGLGVGGPDYGTGFPSLGVQSKKRKKAVSEVMKIKWSGTHERRGEQLLTDEEIEVLRSREPLALKMLGWVKSQDLLNMVNDDAVDHEERRAIFWSMTHSLYEIMGIEAFDYVKIDAAKLFLLARELARIRELLPAKLRFIVRTTDPTSDDGEAVA